MEKSDPSDYHWPRRFAAVYEKALTCYRTGSREHASWFDASEQRVLAEMGLRTIQMFDYAEDFLRGGEPDWETVLLIASARRDYFIHEMNRQTAKEVLRSENLPAREATLDGIRWLPRILMKARGFLQGALPEDVMYCCGGDRKFLREQGLHPADFLRMVWSARGEDARVVRFVRERR